MLRSYKATGIIIRRIEIGEADLLVFVISKEFGLLRLKARGARKIKSKLSGYLQSQSLVYLEIAKGRGEIDTICGAETIDSYKGIKKELIKVAFAFYLLENYLALIGESKDKKAFETIVSAFSYLDSLSVSAGASPDGDDFSKFDKLIYLWVITNLLTCSGQMIELVICSSCGKKIKDGVALSPKDGGVICDLCGKDDTIIFDISHNGIKLLRVLNQVDIGKIREIKISKSDLEKTYTLISAYAEYFIEKKLNSKEFLNLIRGKITNGG